jgi:glyceraldehyde 3-phosphate dehydrogenase
MTKFAINGFGRIGRTALRVWWQQRQQGKLANLELTAINTSGSMEVENWAHLLKYDSNYGVWSQTIKVNRYRSVKDATADFPEIGTIELTDANGTPHVITITAQRDPSLIPWMRYGAEIVVESTGAFTKAEKAAGHFAGGVRHIVLSAPGKSDGMGTTVVGVDEVASLQNKLFNHAQGTIISNASCTTNCIAPVAQIILTALGVEKAMLTTVHAYTDDQNLHDNSHKDLRRARAAAQNIVPTTTGAAKAATKVIPELQGLFDGLALRVPVGTGSISDLTFVTKQDTTVEEVNAILTKASQEPRWQGILAVTDEPLVSSDIVGRPESSIVDLSLTQVIDGNLVKVVAWYDNEWGYCNRLIELVDQVGKLDNHQAPEA